MMLYFFLIRRHVFTDEMAERKPRVINSFYTVFIFIREEYAYTNYKWVHHRHTRLIYECGDLLISTC